MASDAAGPAVPPGLLAAAPAPVPLPVAEAIAREHFGLAARATPLSSERDQNVRLDAADGGAWVLKLTHPDEPRAVTAAQTRALLHAARSDPGLPLPRLRAARDGAVAVDVAFPPDAPPRVARVLALLPGVPLHQASRHPARHAALGRALARLHTALADCDAAGAPEDLPWDLRRARDVAPLLAGAGPAVRGLAAPALAALEAALPRLAALPAQPLHGDFQPWNVLVDEREPTTITGIIDFGDLIAAPPVLDLAVACAYHVHDAPDAAPLAGVAALVGAYHAARPLAEAELALLPVLMAGRMAVTLAITGWRARLHPANAGYILRNAAGAQAGLERLAAIPAADQEALLRGACAAPAA